MWISFFKKKKKKYWTAACTTITTRHYRPLCLAVDHVISLNKQEVRKLKRREGNHVLAFFCCGWGPSDEADFSIKFNSLSDCLEIQVFFYVTYLI